MKTKYFFLIAFALIPAFLCAQDFSPLDSVINTGIRQKLFPGASVAVGTDKGLVYKNYYGRFTYDNNSPAVDSASLFDMASCTKVLATTNCAMKLYDEGKLDIEAPVSRYIPEFAASGKEKVKVRNLLLHNSGLQPYYTPKAGETKEIILNKVFSLPLSFKTDSNTVYSCLNFVTLRQVVEKAAGRPMNIYFKESFADPMGLAGTMFCPPEEYKKFCLPTSDSLQGVVHDPLARGLEGQSGNAGLFSNISDISKICTMLLNCGEYTNRRYLSEAAVKYFTKKFDNSSDRALGWDTKAASTNSSSGSCTSSSAFGHTGYTGTSVWIDPENRIYIILLTNRVFPDDKAVIASVRRAAGDAALTALRTATAH